MLLGKSSRLTAGSTVADRRGRHSLSSLRGRVATVMSLTLLVTACAGAERAGDGSVSGADVAAIQLLLRTRAEAIGRGDLQAFLATIDPTRLALRRTQQQEFDEPNGRVSLSRSTFKVTAPTTYLGYTRAFVEEALEGQGFAGAFAATPANVRRYFRKDGGRWLLSEPTTEELGGEQHRSVQDIDLTYWGVDADLVDIYVKEAQAAH